MNADFPWMHFICRASALSIRVCGFRYLALKLVPIKLFISRTVFETFTSTRTLSDSGYQASAVELRRRFAQSLMMTGRRTLKVGGRTVPVCRLCSPCQRNGLSRA